MVAFTTVRISHRIAKLQIGQASMRKDRNLGIVLPNLFFLTGTYLLYESSAQSQWYTDFFLVAGATISAIGLMTGSGTI